MHESALCMYNAQLMYVEQYVTVLITLRVFLTNKLIIFSNILAITFVNTLL